jgi:hypothetical protein
MLRVCTPIDNDPIFELHGFAQHIVCDVWCEQDNRNCVDKIDVIYQPILSYDWVLSKIMEIDKICEGLSPVALTKIKAAFITNNKIEEICNGVTAIYLNQLDEVVQNEMQPLFIQFYEELLERSKVGGDKLKFYNSLYRINRFKFCICCGYMPFDTGLLSRREAFDHYLPKSKYPFASVNFKNLMPLCYKCNSDRKKDKDPVEGGRKAFYPFRNTHTVIDITTSLGAGFMRSLYETFVNGVDEYNMDPPDLTDIKIEINSLEQEEVDTWEELFQVKGRFSERTSQFSFSHLLKMKRRFNDKKLTDPQWQFDQTLNYHISDYENDKFSDEKFLKIPFMKAMKKQLSFLNVYD